MIIKKFNMLHTSSSVETEKLKSPGHSNKFADTIKELIVYQTGFPAGSADNARDLGSILGLGRSSGEGNSYPLQYSGLDNSMDRGIWQAIVHRATKRQTQLSNLHFTY